MGFKITNGICLAVLIALSAYALVDRFFTLDLFLGFCLLAGLIWLACLPFNAIGNAAHAATKAIEKKHDGPSGERE